MKDYLTSIVVWWAVLWVLYTFWTQLFMSPQAFFVVGCIAAIMVTLWTWAGTPDMCFWDDDDDHSGWP
jgi:hypothetical protein